MTVAFASSKKAIAECDICGFRFKLRELRNIITRGRDTNIKACPECNNADWIEDNREKKQSDPDKFGSIPSWSCSTYQGNNGCGWVAWGDTDCPKEWL